MQVARVKGSMVPRISEAFWTNMLVAYDDLLREVRRVPVDRAELFLPPLVDRVVLDTVAAGKWPEPQKLPIIEV